MTPEAITVKVTQHSQNKQTPRDCRVNSKSEFRYLTADKNIICKYFCVTFTEHHPILKSYKTKHPNSRNILKES